MDDITMCFWADAETGDVPTIDNDYDVMFSDDAEPTDTAALSDRT